MSDKPGTFRKGDKRINRNGRPRSFDKLQALTVEMFNRPALDNNGNPVLIEDRPASVIEVVMWRMIHSKNMKEVQYAIEIAFGKVPDELKLQLTKVILDWGDHVDNDAGDAKST